jgi:hypothetical protein
MGYRKLGGTVFFECRAVCEIVVEHSGDTNVVRPIPAVITLAAAPQGSAPRQLVGNTFEVQCAIETFSARYVAG